MKVKDFVALIEKIAPLSFQEDYDNAGLITGSPEMEVSGILLSLDTTENIVDEAIKNKCNLIISHHPIVFRGLKKLNGKNYVERTLIKAIQNNISIYAAHTNLDNVRHKGVNTKIAEKLGLNDLKIIQPKPQTLSKLGIYCPEKNAEEIRNCMFENGAGNIGSYSECSFSVEGKGSFKPGIASNPFKGEIGKREEGNEINVEVLVANYQIDKVLEAVKKMHPYEEVAYDIIPISNFNQEVGAGIYGMLPEAMDTVKFLSFLKDNMNLEVIKHTEFNKKIQKVAVCGGSGSFLIGAIKGLKADAYITSDIKYHEFFDVEGQYLLCDIGHYESEIYTLEIFYAEIKEKYPNFAVIFCKENTNPIQYFK